MKKNLDHKGRWRKVVVAFRMSQSESDDLNTQVRLSGLTKQDYIIKRLAEREITVVGNPRVYKALRNQMQSIFDELSRLEHSSNINSECLTTIKLVAEILSGLKDEK